MRVWFFKCAGLVLWGLFLCAPLMAKADDGFDIILPFDLASEAKRGDDLFAFVGDIALNLEQGQATRLKDGEWRVKLKAGKDTVLSNDLSEKVRHDRLPLDDGGRESYRVGIGFNYGL